MDMAQEVTKRLPVKKQSAGFDNYKCAVIAALKVFATKWKPCIICYLAECPMRYNELYRIIPNISRKMLSAHLRELESDGLIVRKQYDPKKQHVEYLLSEKGRSLLSILEAIQDWGLQHISGVLSIKDMLAVTM
jgi:DNA-binding HxlR family transcriptional regulator